MELSEIILGLLCISFVIVCLLEMNFFRDLMQDIKSTLKTLSQSMLEKKISTSKKTLGTVTQHIRKRN